MKNFRKQIEKQGKTHKELRGMGTRCAKSLQQLVIKSNCDETLFRKLVDIKIDHYIGNHDNCSDSEKCLTIVKPIRDQEARIAFIVSNTCTIDSLY